MIKSIKKSIFLYWYAGKLIDITTRLMEASSLAIAVPDLVTVADNIMVHSLAKTQQHIDQVLKKS